MQAQKHMFYKLLYALLCSDLEDLSSKDLDATITKDSPGADSGREKLLPFAV